MKKYRHFCLRCGRILTKARDILRGYGPTCWKIMKPQAIKPYIQEVLFVDNGSVEYLSRTYPDYDNVWRDIF